MNLSNVHLTTKLMILVGIIAVISVWNLKLNPFTVMVYSIAAIVPLYLLSTIGKNRPAEPTSKSQTAPGMFTPTKSHAQFNKFENLRQRALAGDLSAAKEYTRLTQEQQKKELADRVMAAGTSPDGYSKY